MSETAPLNGFEARIAKVEAAIQSARDLMAERDHRYSERAVAASVAVASALDGTRLAMSTASSALEKRLDSLNELRGMLTDQTREFARRSEVTLTIEALSARVESLSKTLGALESASLMQMREGQARGNGLKEWGGYLLAIAAIAIALLGHLGRA